MMQHVHPAQQSPFVPVIFLHHQTLVKSPIPSKKRERHTFNHFNLFSSTIFNLLFIFPLTLFVFSLFPLMVILPSLNLLPGLGSITLSNKHQYPTRTLISQVHTCNAVINAFWDIEDWSYRVSREGVVLLCSTVGSWNGWYIQLANTVLLKLIRYLKRQMDVCVRSLGGMRLKARWTCGLCLSSCSWENLPNPC